MKLNIKKPSDSKVTPIVNQAVKGIIDEIQISDLNFGYAPKLGADGMIQGWEPNTKFIERKTEKFFIGGQYIEVTGNLYGVGEPNQDGKYRQTYFHPNVADLETMKNDPDKVIENTILSIISIYKMVLQAQCWQMPVRIASDVANSSAVPESIRDFVGYRYAANLWTVDGLKFSRGQFILYIKSEMQMYETLLKLIRGESVGEDIVFDTAATKPYVEAEYITGVITEDYSTPPRGINFSGHMSGLGNRKPTGGLFTNGEKIAKAGDKGLNLKLKK